MDPIPAMHARFRHRTTDHHAAVKEYNNFLDLMYLRDLVLAYAGTVFGRTSLAPTLGVLVSPKGF